MTDILDIICTSLSVPRPRYVGREELLAMLRQPDIADDNQVSLSDPLFTEVATTRVAELVRTGLVSWQQVVHAALVFGFESTETAKLAREMSAIMEPGAEHGGDRYAWLLQAIELLRAGRIGEIDRGGLIDMLEGVLAQVQDEFAAASLNLQRFLLEASMRPGNPSRHRRVETRRQQAVISDLMEEWRGLAPRAPDLFSAEYATARMIAAANVGLPEASFPAQCPWTLEQALAFR